MAHPLIYYKCMTPEFLKTEVRGVGTAGSDETELHIGKDTQDNEFILDVDLISRGKLKRGDDITVVINVAAEGPPPQTYDPLAIMIGDGDRAMGVQLRDPSEYHTIGPYQGIAGDVGRMLTDITYLPSDEKNYTHGQLQRWPQLFEIKLKPQSYWGVCSSAANGGISLSFTYPRELHIDEGIKLYLFRNKRTETYTINMIEVLIYKDNK